MILCRAGVAQDNILIIKVYLSTVRPVIEYDDGRRAIPDYLSDVIERVQRRA